MRDPYHDRLTEDRRSLVLFECKLGHKVSADGAVLAQLLLEPFRIPLKVSQYPVIRSHEHGCNVHQQLPELDAVAALMRCAEKDDAICRDFDRAVFDQCAVTSSIGMDKSLSW